MENGNNFDKRGYVDLHIHSSASDGESSPKELVKLAAKKKLRSISLTDHDTTKGIAEALDYGEQFGVEVIPGIEIYAKEFGYKIHMLGYFFNPKDSTLIELLREQWKMRKRAIQEKCDGLRDLGFNVSTLDVLVESPQKYIGAKNMVYDIISDPSNKSLVGNYIGEVDNMKKAARLLRDLFFKAEGAPLKGLKTKAVTITDAIDSIHSAGGLSFVAHPYKSLSKETIDEDLKFFQGMRFDGIECISPTNTPEQTAHLLTKADQFGQLVSGGSDYHNSGSNQNSRRGKIELGFGINKNLLIPYQLVEEMKKKLGL
jgi:predicted metal-dependent phosphoesterase TrpH